MRALTSKATIPAANRVTQIRPLSCALAALVGLLVPIVASAGVGTWTVAPSLLTPRAYLGATSAPCQSHVTATCLYAIGGDSAYPGKSAETYLPGSSAWTAIASMQTARKLLGVASGPCQGNLSNTCVYVIGGGNNDIGPALSALSSVEMYTPGSNTWAAIASMRTARGALGVASGPCQGNLSATCIYAMGGYTANTDGTTSTVFNTVEMYSPSSNTWTAVASMQTARGNFAASSGPCQGDLVNTCLYAIGGSDERGNEFSSVEMFAPASNAWTSVGSLPRVEQNFAATSGPCQGALSNTCIYNLGGGFYGTYTDMYSPATNAWVSEANTHADHSGSGAATASCDGTPSTTCLYAIGGGAQGGQASTTVEMYQPSSAPTAAWVSGFVAQRHDATVRFHWQVARPIGVAGFDLYAGTTRLNAHTIGVHRAASYHYSAHWGGSARFTLRVLLRNGTVVTVPVR